MYLRYVNLVLQRCWQLDYNDVDAAAAAAAATRARLAASHVVSKQTTAAVVLN